MTIRRRLATAALGLAVAAAGLAAPASVRAQTASATCPEVTQQNLVIRVCGLGEAMTASVVPIEVSVTNTATNVVGQRYDVTRVDAQLVAQRDGQVLPEPSAQSVTHDAGSTLALSWSPDVPTNGPFVLEVTAYGNRFNDPQKAKASAPFSLAVAPKRPTDVKASVTDAGPVSVSWSIAGQEPDLVLYEVQRAAQGSADFTTISGGVVASTTSTISDSAPVGAWRYQVLAIRRGVKETDGIRSTPSTAATAEVASAPASTSAPAGSTGSTTTGAGSSSSGSATSSGSTTSGTSTKGAPVTSGSRSTVDLSNFAAVLNSRRSTPTTVRRAQPPDPGFSETLPFDTASAANDGREEGGPEAAELGADEPGVGQRLVADAGERRRSLGFVAGGLLLFVLAMTGLFLKSEVRRVEALDDLDALEPAAPTEVPAPTPVPVIAASVVAARPPRRREERARARAERAAELASMFSGEDDDAEAVRTDPLAPDGHHFADLADDPAEAATVALPRRIRRTVAPIDAPSLDVPDPVPAPSARTSHARRTPPRLPSRPADDRREGGAAVRPRRRGTGEGDRRVPVG